jgi:hypothetical protein
MAQNLSDTLYESRYHMHKSVLDEDLMKPWIMMKMMQL